VAAAIVSRRGLVASVAVSMPPRLSDPGLGLGRVACRLRVQQNHVLLAFESCGYGCYERNKSCISDDGSAVSDFGGRPAGTRLPAIRLISRTVSVGLAICAVNAQTVKRLLRMCVDG
jgi:hypothetical protein